MPDKKLKQLISELEEVECSIAILKVSLPGLAIVRKGESKPVNMQTLQRERLRLRKAIIEHPLPPAFNGLTIREKDHAKK